MNPRRARFNALSAERTATATVSLGQALALCDAVHVDMRRLTGEPSWDRYLRLAERIQQADEQLAAELKQRLASGEYLTHDALASLRHDLTLAQARIEARRTMLELPHEAIRLTRAALRPQSDS